MTLYQITQFGSQILHNGTTIFAKDHVDIAPQAKLDIIELANGALFDPNTTNDAPTIPQPFTSLHIIKEVTKAQANTQLRNIKDLIGKRYTLTAAPYDGSASESCTARLEKVDARKNPTPRTLIRLKLHFVPLENLT